MKKYTLTAGLLALGLALTFCQFTPTSFAQGQQPYPGSRQQRQQPNPGSQQQPYPGTQQQPNPGAQQQPSQQQSKTYVGQIVKVKGGQYALLTDKSTHAGHYLDDQKDAKKFAGKKVKVKGTLDVATNTIHVENISPA